MHAKRAAIVFVGTSVYLHFFDGFRRNALAEFAPEMERHFFVLSDNLLSRTYGDTTLIKIPFANARDIKLSKFRLVCELREALSEFDFVFYFDADSVVWERVTAAGVEGWFSRGKSLVGLMHPGKETRLQKKRFETCERSAAYVAPSECEKMPYYCSGFWGGTREAALALAEKANAMVRRDAAIGHVNEHLICDEIYLNRYFLDHLEQLHSLDTERANGANGAGGAGHGALHHRGRYGKPWRNIADDGAYFTHGAYSQFYRKDLASYETLRSYREVNPTNPIHLVSDGGADFSELADRFQCRYVHDKINNGTFAARLRHTNQYLWLKRLREACVTTLVEVDWVMLLESDVECFHPPSRIPYFALNGGPMGCEWSLAMREFFAARWGRLVRHWGLGSHYTGCGGSLFNRSLFVDCFDRVEESLFEQATQLDARVRFAEDAALCFVFQNSGYDTGPWEDFARWNDPEKQTRAVAHGDKRYYGKPFPADDMRPAAQIFSSSSLAPQ